MKSEPVERLNRPRYGALSRPERAQRSITKREFKAAVAGDLAQRHGGVVRRKDLLKAGLTKDDIRAEIERGVWHRVGVHTLSIHSDQPTGEGLWWRALWESTSQAVLDGVTSLQVAGLAHFTWPTIEVSVPNNVRVRHTPGVQHHLVRNLGPTLQTGLRRTRADVAVVRAAQWAASDRQAATIVAMSVQQRLVRPEAVLARWKGVIASPRRELLDVVLRDVCDGAQALGELDFAVLCRRRGLPEPTRQAVRSGYGGRAYLDVLWESLGVHAEIHGAHHMAGLTGLADALRGNEIQMEDPTLITLVIPVLGLRLQEEAFMAQVERALHQARLRRAC